MLIALVLSGRIQCKYMLLFLFDPSSSVPIVLPLGREIRTNHILPLVLFESPASKHGFTLGFGRGFEVEVQALPRGSVAICGLQGSRAWCVDAVLGKMPPCHFLVVARRCGGMRGVSMS